MEDLQIFENEEFGEVRIIVEDGEPYFVGRDVTNVLGYQNGSRDLNRHVEQEDKKTKQINDGIQTRKMITINESGLYSLILSSKKKEAKKFKRWVTSEVLPSIRKHGMYAKDELLDNPDLLIDVAQKLKKEREERRRLETQNKKKDQLIGELKPKADYTDKILKNKGLVTITQIAKDYGMSGRAMNDMLHQLGVQYKQSGQWLLYSKYQDKGYTQSQTFEFERSNGRKDISLNTKWTQKGRLFLYNLLKKNGILPVIEQSEMEQTAAN